MKIAEFGQNAVNSLKMNDVVVNDSCWLCYKR